MARPRKESAPLTREKIQALAIRLLDEGGEKALSFRALATGLGVTPMAVKHHVGTRKELLCALVAKVYDNLEVTATGEEPRARLRFLLRRYCERVLEYPNLTLVIFADPSLISGQLVTLTNLIRSNIAILVGGEEEKETIVGLIVDYTHGFAISVAAAPKELFEGQGQVIDQFIAGINWILGSIGRT